MRVPAASLAVVGPTGMSDEKPVLLPHEQQAPPRTDLWIAAAFLVLGVAVAWLAFLMPTFTDQRGEIYTAPGLVPGVYGVVIVLLSIWLGVRAVRQGALDASVGEHVAAQPATRDWRLAIAAALGLFFVAGLIGRVPFWLASAIFVTLFTVVFEWQPGQAWKIRARRIGEAVAIGLATGAAVTLVFEKVFYVRLP
jgi:Tripartite tricarboxylate transporter TctB family